MNHLTIHTHHQPPQRNPSKNTIPALPGFRTRFPRFERSEIFSEVPIYQERAGARFTRVPPARAGANKPLHLSRTLYKSTPVMQNKPNLHPCRMNISAFLTKPYETNRLRPPRQNKPNQPQSNPISTPALPYRPARYIFAPGHRPDLRSVNRGPNS